MAYIYKILNSVDDRIYVGNTTRSIDIRFAEHIKTSRRDRVRNFPLYVAMNSYGADKFHFELIEEVADTIASEREAYWIGYFDSFRNGYNGTFGGLGRPIVDYDCDGDLICQIYQECSNIKETAQKTGYDIATVKKTLLRRNIAILTSDEYLTKTYGIPVIMYSNVNSCLLQFESANAAARYIHEIGSSIDSIGSSAGHILSVCRGKRKTAFGYLWKYA